MHGLYYVKLAQFLQDHLLFDIDPSNSICLSYVKYLLVLTKKIHLLRET